LRIPRRKGEVAQLAALLALAGEDRREIGITQGIEWRDRINDDIAKVEAVKGGHKKGLPFELAELGLRDRGALRERHRENKRTVNI
jgi:hypothetical protein